MKKTIFVITIIVMTVSVFAEITQKEFEGLKKKVSQLAPEQKNELHSFLEEGMIQVIGAEDMPALEKKVYVILGGFTPQIQKVIFSKGFTGGIPNPILKISVELKDGTSSFEWRELARNYMGIEFVGTELLILLSDKLKKAEKMK